MSVAHIHPVHPLHRLAWPPLLTRHRGVWLSELVLLIGTLLLAAIVKVHPGALPGDLSLTIAWQHFARPIQPLTAFLDFISLITWPQYVAMQIGVLIVLLGFWRRWLDIALALLTAGAADGSNFIISQFDQRPRPAGTSLYVHEHISAFFSFPSGHVEHVVAFLGILVFLSFQVRHHHAWLWFVRIVLMGLIVLMGPARLLEGEHWPSDVLAGLLWGGFWLLLAIQVYDFAVSRLPSLVPLNERKDRSHHLGQGPTASPALDQPARTTEQPGRATALPPFCVLTIVDLALLAGTLILTLIVSRHPGPLPGDLGIILAWQHLVRPVHLVMSFLSFVSLITWPQYVVLQVLLAVAVLLLWRRWLDLIVAVGVVCLSPATNYIIMSLIDRPRPVGPGLYVQEQVTTYSSFPSGHVEYVVAFLGILLFLSFQVQRPQLWHWLLRLPLLTMILCIIPSRVAMGEHWPSDALGGIFWGGFWLVAAIQVYPWAASRWPRLVPGNERKDGPSPPENTMGSADDIKRAPLTGPPIGVSSVTVRGLSEGEVEVRRRAGQGNIEPPATTRTYAGIIRHNLLTFINISLLLLGLTLLWLGRPLDALSAVGLICFNAVVTAIQEIRAKRTLDRTIVVTPLSVTVIRDGQERRLAPSDLVVGDLVKLGPNDGVVVDGRIVDGQIMVDESSLSGRPEYTPKEAGDHILSGSTCISGAATFIAEKVGMHSVIHRVASSARSARRTPTPLQRQINFVFSVSLLAAIYIELLLVVRAVIASANLADSVEQSAVIANLVPESLVLTIALAYAIGAVRILRSGALTQEASAIESLSNVSVLCLDKTGTLTTGKRAGAGEELRPEARDSLAALRRAGIEIKILSGDDVDAVARVARDAGLDVETSPMSGRDLMALDDLELQNVVSRNTVFGGVSAAQKEKVIEALRRRGQYVAMVGDGLNDVPALRRAHVGIALQSGNEVARDAADIVLLNDSLATLAPVVSEGQRIVNGLQPALKLFLTRITASALVILSSLTVAEAFPLRLRHGTILTILAVGVPTVLLALWAKPGPVSRDGRSGRLAHFVIPAAVTSAAIGLLLFYGVLMARILPFIFDRPHYTQAQLQKIIQQGLPTAQTELACFLILTALVLVIFVAPPTRWWTGGCDLYGDWRPAAMAVGLIVGFGTLIEVPFVRSLFGLSPLGFRHLAAIIAGALLWLLVVRGIWRIRLGERLLNRERLPGAWYRHAADGDADSSNKSAEIGWTTDTKGSPGSLQ